MLLLCKLIPVADFGWDSSIVIIYIYSPIVVPLACVLL